ncbi:hypothetical protein AKJ16_DCAP01744, partial [Drosera capensis]
TSIPRRNRNHHSSHVKTSNHPSGGDDGRPGVDRPGLIAPRHTRLAPPPLLLGHDQLRKQGSQAAATRQQHRRRRRSRFPLGTGHRRGRRLGYLPQQAHGSLQSPGVDDSPDRYYNWWNFD